MGARLEIGGFEQSLLFAGLERTDHRDRGHQTLARDRADRIPLRLDLVPLEGGSEPSDQALAVKRRATLAAQGAGGFIPSRPAPPVALLQRQFRADAKAAQAGQGNQKPSVLG